MLGILWGGVVSWCFAVWLMSFVGLWVGCFTVVRLLSSDTCFRLVRGMVWCLCRCVWLWGCVAVSCIIPFVIGGWLVWGGLRGELVLLGYLHS